jgi:hypothetical protein
MCVVAGEEDWNLLLECISYEYMYTFSDFPLTRMHVYL